MTSTLRESDDLLSRFDPVVAPSGPLLVASDASPASDAAFPMARALALRTGASVQVISALRPNAMPTYAFDALPYPVAPTPEILEGRESMVKQQMERLVPAAAPWPVTVRTGDPVREILGQAAASDARLIVVGRGRHGLVERVINGESVLRLLQLGDTPVLAVERTLERLPRNVVIAIDFSVFSIYAAQLALELVAHDASIQLVHVAPNIADSAPVLREFTREYREQAEKSFARVIERLQRPGLRFSWQLLDGNAPARLVEHATSCEADLIVTATHGYGFLRRMVLGSVAAELIRNAPCSLLCVPGSAHTLAAGRAQATTVSDHTRMLPLDQLDDRLFDFTERNAGRACAVEVSQRSIGVRSLGHHMPIVGVTFDRTSGAISMMFGASALEGAHMSHVVPRVTQVDVVTDTQGRDRVLRIVYEVGEVLVMLE